MIISINGDTAICGTGVDILADMCCIIEEIYVSMVKVGDTHDVIIEVISDAVIKACTEGAKRVAGKETE